MTRADREQRAQQVQSRMPQRLSVERVATVQLHTGRWCLIIAGWVIAVEADPCREWYLNGSAWTKETLEQAAAKINVACREHS